MVYYRLIPIRIQCTPRARWQNYGYASRDGQLGITALA